MSPLRLGQLVHTSFAVVGFRTVASTQVPPEIQQDFLEQVVYRYWDSYNPPSAGYRAAYLHQISSEHSLFGWLYNDGLDDFGRSHIPYFLCYYLVGQLHPIQLENILICLCTGPIKLIDRQDPAFVLDNLVLPDLWSYQPARNGVKIPQDMIEENQMALQQKKLLDLFVFTVEERIHDIVMADRRLFSASLPQILPQVIRGALSPYKAPHQPVIQQELPLRTHSMADYQEILLDRANLIASEENPVPFPEKSTLILGLIASLSSLLTLILGSYYFQKVKPLRDVAEPNPSTIAIQNPILPTINFTPTQTLVGHTDAVWSVALTMNGKTLISGSADKSIKVWDLETGKVISSLMGHRDTIRAIALSADEQTLISGHGDGTIKVWDFPSLQIRRTIAFNSTPVWSLAIATDQQSLVTGHEDGTIKIWNFPTGQLLRKIKGHQGRVFSVAMSPDGETFATGGLDKTIKVWSLYTGKMQEAIAQHQDAVRSVIFSRDGKLLISGSWDRTIKIWDVPTGKLLHTLRGHTSGVVALALGMNGKTLISGSTDNQIKIWHLQTGKLLQTLVGHSDAVLAIATYPSQKLLVSASRDKTIQIWQP